MMKTLGAAAILTGGLTATILGLATPAAAAAFTPGNALETINTLSAAGYTVIVNKLGAEPVDQSTVIAVRPGHTYSRSDSGAPGAGHDLVTTITDKTVYVDVK